MPVFRTQTYEDFIRKNFDEFNFDGMMTIPGMEELVMREFCSTKRCVQNHVENLVFLRLVVRLGTKAVRINPDKFPDFHPTPEPVEVKP